MNNIEQRVVYHLQTLQLLEKLKFVQDVTNGWIEPHAYTVYFGTSNPNKIDEFNSWLKICDPALLNLFNTYFEFKIMDVVPDVDECGTTFIENSTLKALEFQKYIEETQELYIPPLVLSDDSGIVIPILGDNSPSVQSAYYSKLNNNRQIADQYIQDHGLTNLGQLITDVEGKDRDYLINKVCVLVNLHKLPNAILPSPAHFVSAVTLATYHKNIITNAGYLYGYVNTQEQDMLKDDISYLKGLNADFGYNSIFNLYNYDKHSEYTLLSSVPLDVRLEWNHRSIAISNTLLDFLIQEIT